MKAFILAGDGVEGIPLKELDAVKVGGTVVSSKLISKANWLRKPSGRVEDCPRGIGGLRRLKLLSFVCRGKFQCKIRQFGFLKAYGMLQVVRDHHTGSDGSP